MTKVECDSCGTVEEEMQCLILCSQCQSDENPQNLSKQLELIRKEMEAIKDTLTILMKRRPDQTCKMRFKQILDELKILNPK